ncbi:unnamed protein product [Pleuronectes platessa]|uniref:Uncharacterized protein n=1 Tax=Pleuronectes platessa TaxID=8262 RepID=A0A9N7V3D6_PLEPL|nr:unnamed protein product [Pleuronectes platessa]
MRDQLAQFDGSRRLSPASDGGGNELLVTGTGSCSSGCLEQICTGHKSYKAQLRAPLLRIAARASQERLSAERAPKHGYNAAGDRPGTRSASTGATQTQELRLGLASESIVPPFRTRNGIYPHTSQADASRVGSKSLTVSQQPADITQRARAEEGAVALTCPTAGSVSPSASSPANTRRLELSRVLWLVIYPGLLRQISASRGGYAM